MVRGYFAYHAVPTNTAALMAFRFQVMRSWRHALSKPGQRHHVTWDLMSRLASQWLPQVRILHADGAFRRQPPKVRAECVNCARSDLRRGCRRDVIRQHVDASFCWNRPRTRSCSRRDDRLQLRHLLEKHKLGGRIFAEVNAYLRKNGVKVSTGTIIDATIISAPRSKNAVKT